MKPTVAARLFAPIMVIGMLAGASQLSAESAELRKLLEAQASETETSLQLSADQTSKIRPILANGVEQRMAVFSELDVSPGNPPGMLTGRKLRSKLDAISTAMKDQLRPILSDAQMQAYDRITEQGKTKIKTAILGQ